MRAVLVAVGTRGDVIPLAALARRLAGRGHEVTLITHSALAMHVPPQVGFVPVDSDPAALLSGPATAAVRSGRLDALNGARDIFAAFMHSFAAPTAAELPRADVLVASTWAVAAVDRALACGVPVARVHTWPESAGGSAPLPLLPHSWRLPPPLRHLARLVSTPIQRYLGGVSGQWRRGRLHLTAQHPVTLTTNTIGSLHAYSGRIAPGPRRGAVVTGWWWPDDPRALTPATEALLARPGPRIVVGFGSMPKEASRRVLAGLDDAADALGLDVLLQGVDDVDRPWRRVTPIGDEPHARLFPRVDAVVHHGGSGTTGEVARAGVPSVVIPYFGDQAFWAHRLHRVGTGTRPLPHRSVTTPGLVRRLDQALSAPMRERARVMGEAVAAEDATGTAVRWLERAVPVAR